MQGRREYRYYVCTKVERSGRSACPVRSVPAGTTEDFVVKHIRTIAADPVMLARIAAIMQRRHAERGTRELLPFSPMFAMT